MSNTAFIILDLQNDISHKDGIYNKNGLDVTNVSKILPNIVDMVFFCKEHSIPIIATQFTILENLNKEAVGLGNFLKKSRPFLEKEGLRLGSWGHDLLDEIKNVNYLIKRWSFSAFYHTELSRHLKALRINELILAGFTTNGIVETTAREAASRNYKIFTLSDLTASYSEELHFASLNNLNSFSEVISSKTWKENFIERQGK
ncbi:MAG: cysteine hydrolase [Parachlamydiales bacterium]|nr:cysteine hydrolase [Parachlamydiales bacterium]